MKYMKYVEFNERDLKQLKHKSFQADNWEQAENFIEYEHFLGNSYFQRLSQLLNRVHDTMKASNGDALKENFTGSQSAVNEELS